MAEPDYTVIADLSGGLNDTFSDIKLSPREALRATNVDLHVDGAVRKRKGSVKLNAVSVGSGKHTNLLYHFKPALGTARYVAAFGDELREWDGANWVLLYTGLDPEAIVLAEAYRNLLYLQNGTDPPLVYAPHLGAPTVFRPGQPAPTGSITKDSDISGSIAAGDIKVRVRFISPIDDIFFGDPDTVDGTTITVTGSGGVRLNIPTYAGGSSPDYRVAKRVVERTKVGPGGIFYSAAIVADNTTTTVDLTEDDDTVGANDIMPASGFREPTPTLFPFTTFRNRVIGADPTDLGLVRFSEIDEFGLLPEAFSDSFYTHRLDVMDALDEPVAVLPMGEYLNWYCGRSIHLMQIDASGNTVGRRLGGYRLGIPSARGVLELPDGHLIVTFKGLYLFTGTGMVHIGDRIEQTWADLPKQALDKMYMVHRYDKRQVKIVLPGATGSSLRNDLALLYHYRRTTANPEGFPTRHAWTVHQGFEAKSGLVARDETTKLDVELSGDYDGTVYTEDTGDTDAHDAAGKIVSEYQTGWLDMGDPRYVKEFEGLWVLVGTPGSDTLEVAWESDFGEGPDGSALLEPAQTLPKFGTAVFGTAVFPTGGSQWLYTFLGEDGVNAYGKYIRLNFTQVDAEQVRPFSILALIFSHVPTRARSDGSS